MPMRAFLLTVCCLLLAAGCPLTGRGQEVLRPVTTAVTVEAGSAHLADSYLSPLRYSGWAVGLTYDRWQAMGFSPERWVRQLNIFAQFAQTRNPVGNALMQNFQVRGSWGMMYRLPLEGLSFPKGNGRFTFLAGGSTTLNLGLDYLQRNGNNPVAAQAAWTLNLTAALRWSFTLGRLPVTLSYQPVLPFIGLFFSPAYGEPYYEIYLGNRKGLVHCGWWGNRFVLENNVALDLRFGATALRLGYHGYILNSKASNIVNRQYTHAFVLGVSGEWMSLSPKGLSQNAKTVSAYY